MDFEFLGTSSGTPSRSRNVSGLALRPEGRRGWVLIDCGEGTQHRILKTRLSLHELAAVFITHLHGDHCYGLPGLLASAGMLNRSAPLTVIGPAPLRAYLDGVIATTQLGLPYRLDVADVERPTWEEMRERTGMSVRAVALSHRMPSYAYVFRESAMKRRLDTERLRAAGIAAGPDWGRLRRGEDLELPDGRRLLAEDWLHAPSRPRTAIVAGDNDAPELLADAMREADVLVHEATYTQPVLDKVGPGPQHSSARMVARVAAAAGLPNLVLTHFSPRYQEGNGPLSMRALEDEARSEYGGRLFLARDLARYRLDRDGRLAEAG